MYALSSYTIVFALCLVTLCVHTMSSYTVCMLCLVTLVYALCLVTLCVHTMSSYTSVFSISYTVCTHYV